MAKEKARSIAQLALCTDHVRADEWFDAYPLQKRLSLVSMPYTRVSPCASTVLRATHIVQVLELTTASPFVYRSQLALRTLFSMDSSFTLLQTIFPFSSVE